MEIRIKNKRTNQETEKPTNPIVKIIPNYEKLKHVVEDKNNNNSK